MNCVICGKEFEEGLKFSNGEMICKDCFESFKSNMNNPQKPMLKEQIIDQIFNASIPEIVTKIKEFSEQKVNMKNLEDDMMESIGSCYEVMLSPECVREYDKIILKYKMQYDVSNVIDFKEISYESKAFQEKLKDFSASQAIAMLNDESFYFLHRKAFEVFPEKEMYQMMFETDSFIGFDIAVLPYIALIRMVWMFHNKATAEQIFIACLRWSKQEKIKEGFMNNKEKYDKVIAMLQEQGPFSEKELKNPGEEILKQLLNKLK